MLWRSGAQPQADTEALGAEPYPASGQTGRAPSVSRVPLTMPFLVTSASGANGDGYGALLAFDHNGKPLGRFSEDERITDPRGLAINRDAGLLFLNSGAERVLALNASGAVVRDTGPIEGLNPGGGIFGPDGRYYVGLRSTRTIMAFRSGLDQAGEEILPPGIVPFPRGFAFGCDGGLFLASGIGQNGTGSNTIVAFAPGKRAQPVLLVADPELGPLDLLIAPNGNMCRFERAPIRRARCRDDRSGI